LFSYAYGYAHKGFKINNTLATRFDTASVTKLFTAMGILQLVDQKELCLRDRVLEILDLENSCVNLKISKDITLYNLLTHTSGIADDADEESGESYEELWHRKPNYSVRENIDFLPQFIYREPYFKPGTGCRYNNCAYILLGLVIEKVTGQKYRQYIKKNVFDKCGMHDTGFLGMDEIHANVAEGYVSIPNQASEVWRKNIYSYPPIGNADAGAYSTTADLNKFMVGILSGCLLSAETTRAMLTPKEKYRVNADYTHMMGYGFEFYVTNLENRIVYISKDGCNPGAAAILKYYPDTEVTVVILANQDCNIWALDREIHQFLMAGDHDEL